MLEVDIEHRLGAFELDIHFRSGRGLTALFGRSGAGKTSVVNAIAGLVRPERGRIVVDGAVLLDTERGIGAPVHRRRVGYVFQEGRLFPHLTVRQNLLFGRWFAPGFAPAAQLDDVVDLLGIGALLDRRPGRLSGGEKQRVAIGRALLAAPRLLLMDEPLASLDARRKDEILPYIERLRDQAGVPIVYVSHAIAEVTRLASTIVLISDGRVRAVGPLQEVMGRAELYPMAGRFEAGAVLAVSVVRCDAHGENGARLEASRHRIEFGASHDLLQRSDRLHPAVRDQHDRVGQPGHLGDRMADIDHRHAGLVAQPLDIGEDLILAPGIERSQRLVHQQQPRAGQ